MDLRELQSRLAALGLYKDKIDGIAGKNTRRAVDAALNLAAEKFSDFTAQTGGWPDSRRMVACEQFLYRDLGIEAGAIDGLAGEQTRYARSIYEARKRGDTAVETWRDKAPAVDARRLPAAAGKWPLQAEVEKVFGLPGDAARQARLTLPFPMRLAWDPEKRVNAVSCHELVREPLFRIWRNTLDHYGSARVAALRLDMYGGCLNVRRMRGGTAWSMHAWGIAWDVDPERNQLRWGSDLAALDDAPYTPFWQIVEAEGAVSLGRLQNFDWMHFQFARLP